jgi:hypothetical protein
MLKVTPTRWWVVHKDGIRDWQQCRRLLQVRFGTENEDTMQKYTGLSFLMEHVTQCIVTWNKVPKKEWTHLFVHTLDTILKNWYLELEVHRETADWEELTHNFKVTFSFEDDAPLIDSTLQVIKNNIFSAEDFGRTSTCM